MKHAPFPPFLTGLLMALLFSASILTAQQTQRVDEKDLRDWADRGDADAQFELGLRMITGEGLKKNIEEGVKSVEKAAKQKHLRAQHVLGTLYEDGVGVKKDLAKAAEWYRSSAELGFALSQHSLATMYEDGKGVKKDTAKAAEWFKKAADQGSPPSQTAYASKLERGDGIDKSLSKAALWYLKAAQQDFVPAMSRLANLYYTGQGLPVDYRRAGAWYRRAARSEDPWAANNLAWFLATCPEDNLHNGESAVLLARRALKLVAEVVQSDEQPYEMIDTMAAALARNGEFKEAELWQKRCINLLNEDKDLPVEDLKKLQEEFDTRLKLYQKATPFAEPDPKGEEGAEPLPQDTILQDEGLPESKSKKNTPKGGRGTVV
ncbi:tetratricopeptide repeat protein [Prosthecobacter sp.]|uniref:tetratricopeptide repeat protein n=1 Tax=Prosthecobacter sp. TaxID=1965333 RepID=UPI00248862F6|nr:tetratricopeptide repeat protein [Prosthecobacter sp.]MDI1314552.1 tetratricopeptide repeat protein [Prosthecobacter sp.]